jgi:peptidoglycan/xylan/chitin deacetylase (PgdA/CDA1 family)
MLRPSLPAMPGTLIISLDFELYWGVRDVATLKDYGANLRGTRQAIPAVLALFERQGIRATWATVGFLFFDSKADLLAHLPDEKPQYANSKRSPYPVLAGIGESEAADPYHFGRALLEQIRAVPGQEIGSHTFSHYYALERGQTPETFRQDLGAALAAGGRIGAEIRSLAFPRNQYNASYIEICREFGLTSYRGNEESWIYRQRTEDHEPFWKRGARLLDAYVNMSGHHTFRLADVARSRVPFNLPASRFLRPWSPRLRWFEELRLRRIERAMTHAARHGEAFHLWWHPHNFGVNLSENLANLTRLLSHFRHLRTHYGMESSSMGDVAARLLAESASSVSAVA